MSADQPVPPAPELPAVALSRVALSRVALSRAELRRYSRPLLVPEWLAAGAQESLGGSRALLVGAGGLGGPVALQLAGAGVGTLTIADMDTVSVSNLHRQTHFNAADVGRLKAEALCAKAQALNPFVSVTALGAFEAAFVTGYNLVIDATDNFAARYAIADACSAAQIPWVWGAASGTSGMVSVFDGDFGLRQLFPEPDDSDSCAEVGVLGPVPNIVGGVMALEALKVLGGLGETLRGRLWTFDALDGKSRLLKLQPEA